jgi:hypothetical protein
MQKTYFKPTKEIYHDQNFYTKDLDLVPILESLRNEESELEKKVTPSRKKVERQIYA